VGIHLGGGCCPGAHGLAGVVDCCMQCGMLLTAAMHPQVLHPVLMCLCNSGRCPGVAGSQGVGGRAQDGAGHWSY
jgi:hypothetical protein